MLSKNEIKYIQSLCQKKFRQEEGTFIVEGTKLATELLNSDFTIRKIYALADWKPAFQLPVAPINVTAEELAKISNLQTPNQVLMVVEQKQQVLLSLPETGITIMLDGIQDPGNLGTIIRIADWFGIKTIIAGEHTADLYNPKVIQSTMGSFSRVKVVYRSLEELLGTSTLPVYGALLKGLPIQQSPTIQNGLLLIGNESKGISENLLQWVSNPVTIPRIGGAESLNAAVATGIILSHLIK
jgi:RNA methyltransferase, TrmH family